MNKRSKDKIKELTSKGQTRVIQGKKILVLPCVEPEYVPKVRRRKGNYFRKIRGSQ